MKIALIGATGFAGSKILDEALARHHQVTAIVRNVDKLPKKAQLKAQQVDIANEKTLTEALKGHDVVISSVHFTGSDFQKLRQAVREAHVPRWLVVGGAGSLEIKPGLQVIDTPDFPAAYKAEASAGRDFLNKLKQEKEIDWTFLSPSAEFVPGERTGQFRLGQDELLISKSGRSFISTADFAIAMLNEVEKPAHSRRRFTVGY